MKNKYIIITFLALFTFSCKSSEKLINGKWINLTIINSKDPLILDFKDQNIVTFIDGNLDEVNFKLEQKDDFIEIIKIDNNSVIYDQVYFVGDTLKLINSSEDYEFSFVQLDNIRTINVSKIENIGLEREFLGLWKTKNLYNKDLTNDVYFDFFSKNKALYNYTLAKNNNKVTQPIEWGIVNFNDLYFLKLKVFEEDFIYVTNIDDNNIEGIFINKELRSIKLTKVNKYAEVSSIEKMITGKWCRKNKLTETEKKKLIYPYQFIPDEIAFIDTICRSIFYDDKETETYFKISNDAQKIILDNLNDYHNDLIYIKEITDDKLVLTYNIKGIGKKDFLFNRK